MTDVKKEVEDICHEEQLRIWADDNIMAALAMGGYLRDLDYSEGVELQQMLMREIKSVVEMALSHSTITLLAEDKRRLDFLDSLNARLNDKYGTTYRWKMTMTHNVNRLALDFPKVDLQDAEANGLKSCRLAIDAEIERIDQERTVQRATCSVAVTDPAPAS